jgi:ubiquinone/menaquinone biosynthesis C-methylase UbiE
MHLKTHWEHVYETKSVDAVSWFQPHAERSMCLIHQSGVPKTASIIDVGGGASILVDDLLDDGFRAVTVLDLSGAALAAAEARLGKRASSVTWIEADITQAVLPDCAYDIWHDRATFHFLTDDRDRKAYIRAVKRSVKPGGYVIVATFAEDGPIQCSGLPVVRYSPDALQAEFGAAFAPTKHERAEHLTPSGKLQKFIYCCLRRNCDAQ